MTIGADPTYRKEKAVEEELKPKLLGHYYKAMHHKGGSYHHPLLVGADPD